MNKDNLVGLIPCAGKASRLGVLPFSKELYPIGFDKFQGIQCLKVVSSYLIEHMQDAGVKDFHLIIKEENQIWANNLQQNISYPYHVNHFRRYFLNDSISGDIEVAKPFNYKALINDDKFKSINAEIISNRNWNINSLKELSNKSIVIVNQI